MNKPKNIFYVLVLGETNSPSDTSGLHYLSTFNSANFQILKLKKRNIIIHWYEDNLYMSWLKPKIYHIRGEHANH